ncbi:MAG: glycosyltransferase family 2 protein, partial [Sphaerochaetaceae bacterium]
MKETQVYFIILNFNGYSDTVECLESLRHLKNQNFQVILVDNASTNDEGQRLAAEFPECIHILNEKNTGFAGGNNIGVARALQEADCGYIFFLNNDTTVEPDLLDQLLMVVDNPENQAYGFFQPKMINYFQRELMDSAGLDYSWNGLGFNRGGNQPVGQYNDNQEILGCCGGAFLCRRQAVEDLWQQVGDFFAEEFFAYCEDLDASLRLQWAG